MTTMEQVDHYRRMEEMSMANLLYCGEWDASDECERTGWCEYHAGRMDDMDWQQVRMIDGDYQRTVRPW